MHIGYVRKTHPSLNGEGIESAIAEGDGIVVVVAIIVLFHAHYHFPFIVSRCFAEPREDTTRGAFPLH